MKTLIAYSSKTGNTKKVAEAVSLAIPNADLRDISEVNSLDYDLIIVGTWIDKATADAKALKFIKSIKNKKTAYFFTLGAYPDSQHARDCSENISQLFKENNNELLGHYLCQGAIDPKLIEWMSALPADHSHAPDEARKKRWKDASFHPNEEDLTNAAKAFKEIFENIK